MFYLPSTENVEQDAEFCCASDGIHEGEIREKLLAKKIEDDNNYCRGNSPRKCGELIKAVRYAIGQE